MKTELATFLKSFLSRKFLASMAAAGTLYANGQVKMAAGAVALWVLAEAAVDFKGAAPLIKEAEAAIGAALPPPPPPSAG
jgi:hypothetical protein